MNYPKEFLSEIQTRVYPNECNWKTIKYQRKLSKTHWKNIQAKLADSIVLKEAFVINVRENGDEVLLDGYHRKKALDENHLANPVVKMIKVEVYKNLTPDEEKEIYFRYNSGKPHTANDLLRPYVDELIFCKLVQSRNFPIEIVNDSYEPRDKCSMQRLISYLVFANEYAQGTIKKDDYRRYVAIELDSKNQSKIEANNLKQFLNLMRSVLGRYDRNIALYKNLMMGILLRLYYVNVIKTKKLTDLEFKRRIKEVNENQYFLSEDKKELMKTNEGSARKHMLRETVDFLNGQFRKKPILASLKDVDEDEVIIDEEENDNE